MFTMRFYILGIVLVIITGRASGQPAGGEDERSRGKRVLEEDVGGSSPRARPATSQSTFPYAAVPLSQHPPATPGNLPTHFAGAPPMLVPSQGVSQGAQAGPGWVWPQLVSHPVPQQNPQALSRGAQLVHAEWNTGNRLKTVLSPPGHVPESASEGPIAEIDEWAKVMRTMLGNPKLRFLGIAGQGKEFARVFEAQDAVLSSDHLQPGQSGQPSGQPSDVRPIGRRNRGKPHLLSDLMGVQTVQVKDIRMGDPWRRRFVYLNSRFNMEWYGNTYFQGQMRFLPIRPSGLLSGRLNNIFTMRKIMHILPPAEPHGLPLLVARHATRKGLDGLKDILAEDYVNNGQVMSLWAPVMVGKDRSTVVLYGIGQLKDSKPSATLMAHLSRMSLSWRGGPLSPEFDLDTILPHRLA